MPADLAGKTLLLCRPREESHRWETVFRGLGAQVEFLPTFRIEPVASLPEHEYRLLSERLQRCDWLILSSPHGVSALRERVAASELRRLQEGKLPVAIVGRRAEKALLEEFAGAHVARVYPDLQAAIDGIGEAAAGAPKSLLHITSEQSLQNIQVNIPAGVTLERAALYRTVPEKLIPDDVARRLSSGRFSVIVFGSPSAFDYLRQLLQDRSVLKRSALAAFGKTTAAYMRARGFPADIIPESPQPQSLAAAIVEFFSTHKIRSSAALRQ